MTRQAQQFAAIAAIAEERYDQAAYILEQLRAAPKPLQPGVCRFCGCSEARACGIVDLSERGPFGDLVDPVVVRCGWADPACTVCTNISCVERWRRESPAELDVDLHDVVAAEQPR